MTRFPSFYRPPMGLPLNWRDEMSGELPAAVTAYINNRCGEGPEPTRGQLDLLIEWLQHWINAPVWAHNLSECEEMLAELLELRKRAETLASSESIALFVEEMMEMGIDPF